MTMTIYGLFGFTHGWGRLLTVMSPEGATAARAAIDLTDEITVDGGPGRLTQYHEKRAGALEHLVERNGIIVLSRAEWEAKKVELGDVIWS